MSPSSLTMTAASASPAASRIWFRRVVLPLPRNPVSNVTGISGVGSVEFIAGALRRENSAGLPSQDCRPNRRRGRVRYAPPGQSSFRSNCTALTPPKPSPIPGEGRDQHADLCSAPSMGAGRGDACRGPRLGLKLQ